MRIFPAIDLVRGQAVRLLQGDYDRMTVYDTEPLRVAAAFRAAGASYLHVVDLEGARDGGTPNLPTVTALARESGLFLEIGGGVRSLPVIEAYLSAGVGRVILGTAAVRDPAFLREALRRYGSQVAVGVDVKQGYVAVQGWTELSDRTCLEFCTELEQLGASAVICTDVSRDGAMGGSNRELYRQLLAQLSLEVIASGGVSSIEEVRALAELGLHGAIIGKAYYTGAIDLAEAIRIGAEHDN